jgi:hypothetical protein
MLTSFFGLLGGQGWSYEYKKEIKRIDKLCILQKISSFYCTEAKFKSSLMPKIFLIQTAKKKVKFAF